ncbi:hypothetical protein [Mycobacterium sp. MMS18-G62]
MSFSEELNSLARAGQHRLHDKAGLFSGAVANQQRASSTIIGLLRDAAAFLTRTYPHIGLPLVSYNDEEDGKRFASARITPLGHSWLIGQTTLTDRAVMYHYRRECAVVPKVKVLLALKKYALSIGIPEGGSIGWVPERAQALSVAPTDLALVLENDWYKSTYGGGHPDTWRTTAPFPGQRPHEVFGLFPDGRPAVITYSPNDGESWTATELSAYLKWGIKQLIESHTQSSHRHF